MYLIYSYQYNNELVAKGPNRGHDEAFLSHFRRECLLVSPHISRIPTRGTFPARNLLWVWFGERIRPSGLFRAAQNVLQQEEEVF